MTTEEAIQQAYSLLEQCLHQPSETPSLIVMPPDGGEFIVGNRPGYVRLAMAALNAACGKDQSFKSEPWVKEFDFDWGLAGLKFEPNMSAYDPPVKTRAARIRESILRYAFLSVFIIPFALGWVWIIKLLAAAFHL